MDYRHTGELELLAPARNSDIGIAAIDCGADAVYIAGPMFGARQAAGNSVEDIRKLCEYAHRFGARVFITLNTILYDNELDEAMHQMLAVRDAGADAIIVQDMAVMEMARRNGAGLPLHASTQCAIRTPEQARFYEDAGFSRLILERELSLEQIRKIREAVSCELEFFVHGALCVCYSGQCYMSEAISGRSANRGACIQACRSLYDLTDETGKTLVRNKAVLSLKDFNLRDRLKDLADAGISSFKIEGRLKNESYVRNVVRDYSIALERVVSSDEGKYCRASFGHVSGGFRPDPDKTFNRGYTELFIDGRRGQWSTFDSAKGMGEEIGTAASVNPQKTALKIRPGKKWQGDSPLRLNNGDGLSFVSRSGEVVGFRADICNNLEIKCKNIPELYVGARLFRNVDTAFEKDIANNPPVREIHVDLTVSVIHGEGSDSIGLEVRAVSEDGREAARCFETGNTFAENQERMESVFKAQLEKSAGHYRFSVKRVVGTRLPFVPVSMLNSVRREMAALLDKMPCRKRELENRTLSDKYPLWQDKADSLAEKAVSYKSNVANSLAEGTYIKAGAVSVEKAFEITHRRNAELMRTKYCVRHELGICPRQKPGPASPLFLLNNGRRFRLDFDCARCEMTVSE